MEDLLDSESKRQELQEFYKILGFTATVNVLKSIQKGEDQCKYFYSIASTATINSRIRGLIMLRIIKHHIVREPKRKEWYTLTERGKRIVEAVIELEKAFKGNDNLIL